MWKLVCEKKPDVVHRLIVGKEYNIGRRDCEIIIPDDMSISRKHALVKVIHPDVNLSVLEKKSILHFKDVSKLGTQLKDGRIANGEERTISNGDLLVFGTAGVSRYRAVCEPFVVTASCLIQVAKKNVKCNVLKLGGHLVSEWTNDCRMVIMNNLSVTIKVISALLSLKPIVTPQYLEDLVKAVEGSSKLPDAEDYLPSLSESQVNSTDVSFCPDSRRPIIFAGKTFVFLSANQFKKLHAGVELGGAKTRLITEDAADVEALVAADGVSVMASDEAGSSLASNVMTHLKRAKRRMIAESEIGFAVLYCSTASHCNPSAEIGGSSVRLPSQSISQNFLAPSAANDVPACRSQTPRQSQSVKRLVVPEESEMFRSPVPPIKIKEEPLSQPVAEQQTNRNKKRIWDETEGGANDPAVAVESTPSKKSRQQVPSEGECTMSLTNPRPTGVNWSLSSALPTKADSQGHSGPSLAAQAPAVTEMSNRVTGSTKRNAFPIPDTGSLDMDFSIGSIISSASTSVKVEDDDILRSVFGANQSEDVDVAAKRSPATSENVGLPGTAAALPVERSTGKSEETDFKRFTKFVDDKCTKEKVQVQPGFLTTALPIQLPVDPDFVKIEDLPVAVVVTEVRSLVARQPGQQKSKVVTGSSVVIWKGRAVKNFKKFHKVPGMVVSGLPRIIGGKDLVVHQSVSTAEREDWFRSEQMEAESQRQNSERLTQELFSWQPNNRRR